jgi:LysM repeat protein
MKTVTALLLIVVLCLALAQTAHAETRYIVQPGDTLYRIATRFGVSVSALAAANGLANPSLIYVGQVLVIPGATGGEPPAGPSQYVVQRGDTLWRIAQRFGTTVQALQRANGLSGTRIYPGQILTLPAAGAATPAPNATAAPGITPTPPPQATPCAHAWFFANPPAGACPAAAPLVTVAAAERFERGLMLWLSQTDTFYVFQQPEPGRAAPLTVVVGPLQIAPGGSVDNRVGGAPAGYFEPVSGFGLLWRGEVGQYPTALRPALGWALEAEHSIETTLQCQAYPGTSFASPTCFLQGPAGEVLHIWYVRYFGYFWEQR